MLKFFFSRSPKMHKEVSDLPLPDSPIRPTISFFFILNETDLINFLFLEFSAMPTHSFFISSNIFLFDFKDYSIEVGLNQTQRRFLMEK